MTAKAEKVRTVRASSDGDNYYARFKPALSPTRLDAVLKVAPTVADYRASSSGKIKELVFDSRQFEPGLKGPPDFLAHLGRMAARINCEIVSDGVEFRPKSLD